MIGPTRGVWDTNVLGGMVFLFHQISAEFFVPTTCDQFIFSRLPNRKIKKFSVSWVYFIPFPVFFKPTFPISRLKKWQIPRPEKALLGPCEDPSRLEVIKSIWWNREVGILSYSFMISYVFLQASAHSDIIHYLIAWNSSSRQVYPITLDARLIIHAITQFFLPIPVFTL